jgi:hypothetical protein
MIPYSAATLFYVVAAEKKLYSKKESKCEAFFFLFAMYDDLFIHSHIFLDELAAVLVFFS